MAYQKNGDNGHSRVYVKIPLPTEQMEEIKFLIESTPALMKMYEEYFESILNK